MRARQVRLVVSLVVASLLATVLVYTAFAGKTRVLQVGELLAKPGVAAKDTVRLNGEVVSHSGQAHSQSGMRFVLEDNLGSGRRLTVVYRGNVPDAFHDGRNVLVDGKLDGKVFMAKTDSLSTKCPSKYQAAQKDAGPVTAAS
jgi:cytochrome c-type biogenesis protein CcmE